MGAQKEKKKSALPRSRQIHEAGLKTLADATRCAEAVFADLEAGLIDATEANRITNAVGQWRRAFTRKAAKR